MRFRQHCGGGRSFGPGFALGYAMGGRGRRGQHWGRAAGNGGRRRMFDGSELRLVILKLIADEPRHGYDLIRAIEELTGGGYAPSPGIVYPSITMLQDMGHIAESVSTGARKVFAVTAEGEAELAARTPEIAALMARLEGLNEARARPDGAPVRRAMGNLRTALEDRLSRDDADAALLHEAAALLDDAAQKIERLQPGATR